MHTVGSLKKLPSSQGLGGACFADLCVLNALDDVVMTLWDEGRMPENQADSNTQMHL